MDGSGRPVVMSTALSPRHTSTSTTASTETHTTDARALQVRVLQLETSLTQAMEEMKAMQAAGLRRPGQFDPDALGLSPGRVPAREVLQLEVENKGLQRQIADLEVEVERRKQSAHRAKAKLSEKSEHVDRLESELRTVRDKLRQTTTQLSDLRFQQEEATAALQSKLAACERENTTLARTATSYQSQLHAQADKLAAAERHSQELQGRLDDVSKAAPSLRDIKSWESRAEQAEATLATMRSDLDAARKQISTLQSSASAAESQAAEERRRLQMAAQAARTEALTQEDTHKHQLVTARRDEQARQREVVVELEAQLRATRRDLRDAHATYAQKLDTEREAVVADYQQRLERCRAESTKLVNAVRDEAQQMMRQYAEERSEESAGREDLKLANSKLARDLAVSKAEASSLRAEMDDAIAQRVAAVDRANEATARCQAREEGLDADISRRVQAVQDEAAQQQHAIQESHAAELSQLQADLQAARHELAQALDDCQATTLRLEAADAEHQRVVADVRHQLDREMTAAADAQAQADTQVQALREQVDSVIESRDILLSQLDAVRASQSHTQLQSLEQSSRLQHLVNALTDILSVETPSDMMAAVAASAAAACGATAACLRLVSEDGEVLRGRGSSLWSTEEGLLALCFRSGTTVLRTQDDMSDYSAANDCFSELPGATPTALLCVPVVLPSSTEPVGVVALVTHDDRVFTEDDCAAADVVAKVVGVLTSRGKMVAAFHSDTRRVEDAELGERMSAAFAAAVIALNEAVAPSLPPTSLSSSSASSSVVAASAAAAPSSTNTTSGAVLGVLVREAVSMSVAAAGAAYVVDATHGALVLAAATPAAEGSLDPDPRFLVSVSASAPASSVVAQSAATASIVQSDDLVHGLPAVALPIRNVDTGLVAAVLLVLGPDAPDDVSALVTLCAHVETAWKRASTLDQLQTELASATHQLGAANVSAQAGLRLLTVAEQLAHCGSATAIAEWVAAELPALVPCAAARVGPADVLLPGTPPASTTPVDGSYWLFASLQPQRGPVAGNALTHPTWAPELQTLGLQSTPGSPVSQPLVNHIAVVVGLAMDRLLLRQALEAVADAPTRCAALCRQPQLFVDGPVGLAHWADRVTAVGLGAGLDGVAVSLCEPTGDLGTTTLLAVKHAASLSSTTLRPGSRWHLTAVLVDPESAVLQAPNPQAVHALVPMGVSSVAAAASALQSTFPVHPTAVLRRAELLFATTAPRSSRGYATALLYSILPVVSSSSSVLAVIETVRVVQAASAVKLDTMLADASPPVFAALAGLSLHSWAVACTSRAHFPVGVAALRRRRLLVGAFTALRRNVDTIHLTRAAAHAQDLQDQLDAAVARTTKAGEDVAAVSGANAQLQHRVVELDDTRQAVVRLEAAVAARDSTISNLRTETASLESRLKEATKLRTEAQTHADHVQQAHDSLDLQIQALERELSRQRDAAAELDKEHTHVLDQLTAVTDDRNTLELSTAELRRADAQRATALLASRALSAVAVAVSSCSGLVALSHAVSRALGTALEASPVEVWLCRDVYTRLGAVGVEESMLAAGGGGGSHPSLWTVRAARPGHHKLITIDDASSPLLRVLRSNTALSLVSDGADGGGGGERDTGDGGVATDAAIPSPAPYQTLVYPIVLGSSPPIGVLQLSLPLDSPSGADANAALTQTCAMLAVTIQRVAYRRRFACMTPALLSSPRTRRPLTGQPMDVPAPILRRVVHRWCRAMEAAVNAPGWAGDVALTCRLLLGTYQGDDTGAPHVDTLIDPVGGGSCSLRGGVCGRVMQSGMPTVVSSVVAADLFGGATVLPDLADGDSRRLVCAIVVPVSFHGDGAVPESKTIGVVTVVRPVVAAPAAVAAVAGGSDAPSRVTTAAFGPSHVDDVVYMATHVASQLACVARVAHADQIGGASRLASVLRASMDRRLGAALRQWQNVTQAASRDSASAAALHRMTQRCHQLDTQLAEARSRSQAASTDQLLAAARGDAVDAVVTVVGTDLLGDGRDGGAAAGVDTAATPDRLLEVLHLECLSAVAAYPVVGDDNRVTGTPLLGSAAHAPFPSSDVMLSATAPPQLVASPGGAAAPSVTHSALLIVADSAGATPPLAVIPIAGFGRVLGVLVASPTSAAWSPSTLDAVGRVAECLQPAFSAWYRLNDAKSQHASLVSRLSGLHRASDRAARAAHAVRALWLQVVGLQPAAFLTSSASVVDVDDGQAVLSAAVSTVGPVLGLEPSTPSSPRLCLLRWDGHAMCLRWVGGGEAADSNAGLVAAAARDGNPLLVEAVSEDSRFDAAVDLPVGLQSQLLVPASMAVVPVYDPEYHGLHAVWVLVGFVGGQGVDATHLDLLQHMGSLIQCLTPASRVVVDVSAHSREASERGDALQSKLNDALAHTESLQSAEARLQFQLERVARVQAACQQVADVGVVPTAAAAGGAVAAASRPMSPTEVGNTAVGRLRTALAPLLHQAAEVSVFLASASAHPNGQQLPVVGLDSGSVSLSPSSLVWAALRTGDAQTAVRPLELETASRLSRGEEGSDGESEGEGEGEEAKSDTSADVGSTMAVLVVPIAGAVLYLTRPSSQPFLDTEVRDVTTVGAAFSAPVAVLSCLQDASAKTERAESLVSIASEREAAMAGRLASEQTRAATWSPALVELSQALARSDTTVADVFSALVHCANVLVACGGGDDDDDDDRCGVRLFVSGATADGDGDDGDGVTIAPSLTDWTLWGTPVPTAVESPHVPVSESCLRVALDRDATLVTSTTPSALDPPTRLTSPNTAVVGPCAVYIPVSIHPACVIEVSVPGPVQGLSETDNALLHLAVSAVGTWTRQVHARRRATRCAADLTRLRHCLSSLLSTPTTWTPVSVASCVAGVVRVPGTLQVAATTATGSNTVVVHQASTGPGAGRRDVEVVAVPNPESVAVQCLSTHGPVRDTSAVAVPCDVPDLSQSGSNGAIALSLVSSSPSCAIPAADVQLLNDLSPLVGLLAACSASCGAAAGLVGRHEAERTMLQSELAAVGSTLRWAIRVQAIVLQAVQDWTPSPPHVSLDSLLFRKLQACVAAALPAGRDVDECHLLDVSSGLDAALSGVLTSGSPEVIPSVQSDARVGPGSAFAGAASLLAVPVFVTVGGGRSDDSVGGAGGAGGDPSSRHIRGVLVAVRLPSLTKPVAPFESADVHPWIQASQWLSFGLQVGDRWEYHDQRTAYAASQAEEASAVSQQSVQQLVATVRERDTWQRTAAAVVLTSGLGVSSSTSAAPPVDTYTPDGVGAAWESCSQTVCDAAGATAVQLWLARRGAEEGPAAGSSVSFQAVPTVSAAATAGTSPRLPALSDDVLLKTVSTRECQHVRRSGVSSESLSVAVPVPVGPGGLPAVVTFSWASADLATVVTDDVLQVIGQAVGRRLELSAELVRRTDAEARLEADAQAAADNCRHLQVASRHQQAAVSMHSALSSCWAGASGLAPSDLQTTKHRLARAVARHGPEWGGCLRAALYVAALPAHAQDADADDDNVLARAHPLVSQVLVSGAAVEVQDTASDARTRGRYDVASPLYVCCLPLGAVVDGAVAGVLVLEARGRQEGGGLSRLDDVDTGVLVALSTHLDLMRVLARWSSQTQHAQLQAEASLAAADRRMASLDEQCQQMTMCCQQWQGAADALAALHQASSLADVQAAVAGLTTAPPPPPPPTTTTTTTTTTPADAATTTSDAVATTTTTTRVDVPTSGGRADGGFHTDVLLLHTPSPAVADIIVPCIERRMATVVDNASLTRQVADMAAQRATLDADQGVASVVTALRSATSLDSSDVGTTVCRTVVDSAPTVAGASLVIFKGGKDGGQGFDVVAACGDVHVESSDVGSWTDAGDDGARRLALQRQRAAHVGPVVWLPLLPTAAFRLVFATEDAALAAVQAMGGGGGVLKGPQAGGGAAGAPTTAAPPPPPMPPTPPFLLAIPDVFATLQRTVSRVAELRSTFATHREVAADRDEALKNAEAWRTAAESRARDLESAVSELDVVTQLVHAVSPLASIGDESSDPALFSTVASVVGQLVNVSLAELWLLDAPTDTLYTLVEDSPPPSRSGGSSAGSGGPTGAAADGGGGGGATHRSISTADPVAAMELRALQEGVAVGHSPVGIAGRGNTASAASGPVPVSVALYDPGNSNTPIGVLRLLVPATVVVHPPPPTASGGVRRRVGVSTPTPKPQPQLNAGTRAQLQHVAVLLAALLGSVQRRSVSAVALAQTAASLAASEEGLAQQARDAARQRLAAATRDAVFKATAAVAERVSTPQVGSMGNLWQVVESTTRQLFPAADSVACVDATQLDVAPPGRPYPVVTPGQPAVTVVVLFVEDAAGAVDPVLVSAWASQLGMVFSRMEERGLGLLRAEDARMAALTAAADVMSTSRRRVWGSRRCQQIFSAIRLYSNMRRESRVATAAANVLAATQTRCQDAEIELSSLKQAVDASNTQVEATLSCIGAVVTSAGGEALLAALQQRVTGMRLYILSRSPVREEPPLPGLDMDVVAEVEDAQARVWAPTASHDTNDVGPVTRVCSTGTAVTVAVSDADDDSTANVFVPCVGGDGLVIAVLAAEPSSNCVLNDPNVTRALAAKLEDFAAVVAMQVAADDATRQQADALTREQTAMTSLDAQSARALVMQRAAEFRFNPATMQPLAEAVQAAVGAQAVTLYCTALDGSTIGVSSRGRVVPVPPATALVALASSDDSNSSDRVYVAVTDADDGSGSGRGSGSGSGNATSSRAGDGMVAVLEVLGADRPDVLFFVKDHLGLVLPRLKRESVADAEVGMLQQLLATEQSHAVSVSSVLSLETEVADLCMALASAPSLPAAVSQAVSVLTAAVPSTSGCRVFVQSPSVADGQLVVCDAGAQTLVPVVPTDAVSTAAVRDTIASGAIARFSRTIGGSTPPTETVHVLCAPVVGNDGASVLGAVEWTSGNGSALAADGVNRVVELLPRVGTALEQCIARLALANDLEAAGEVQDSLQGIAQLLRDVSSATDVAGVFRKSRELVLKVLHADDMSLCVVPLGGSTGAGAGAGCDPGAPTVAGRASTVLHRYHSSSGFTTHVAGTGLVGRAAATGKCVALESTSAAALVASSYDPAIDLEVTTAEGVRGRLTPPLGQVFSQPLLSPASGRAVGVLQVGVASAVPAAAQASYLRVLAAVGDALARGIDRILVVDGEVDAVRSEALTSVSQSRLQLQQVGDVLERLAAARSVVDLSAALVHTLPVLVGAQAVCLLEAVGTEGGAVRLAVPTDRSPSIRPSKLAAGVTAQALSAGSAVRVVLSSDGPRTAVDPTVDVAAGTSATGALLVLPVVSDTTQQPLGVLQLWSTSAAAFTPTDVDLLRKVVTVVGTTWQAFAVAGECRQLQQEKEARDAVALAHPSIHELCGPFLRATSHTDVMTRLRVIGRALVASVHSTLFLYDVGAGQVVVPGVGEAEQRFTLAAGQLLEALTRRSTTRIDDVAVLGAARSRLDEAALLNSAGSSSAELPEHHFSLMFVPVRDAEGRAVAVVRLVRPTAGSDGPFGPEEELVASVMAGYVSGALANLASGSAPLPTATVQSIMDENAALKVKLESGGGGGGAGVSPPPPPPPTVYLAVPPPPPPQPTAAPSGGMHPAVAGLRANAEAIHEEELREAVKVSMKAVQERDEALSQLNVAKRQVDQLHRVASSSQANLQQAQRHKNAVDRALARLKSAEGRARRAEDRAVQAEAYTKKERARTDMEARKMYARLRGLETELKAGKANLKGLSVMSQKLRAATADNALLSKALRRLMEGQHAGQHVHSTGNWVLQRTGVARVAEVVSVDGDAMEREAGVDGDGEEQEYRHNVPLTSMERK